LFLQNEIAVYVYVKTGFLPKYSVLSSKVMEKIRKFVTSSEHKFIKNRKYMKPAPALGRVPYDL